MCTYGIWEFASQHVDWIEVLLLYVGLLGRNNYNNYVFRISSDRFIITRMFHTNRVLNSGPCVLRYLLSERNIYLTSD